MNAYIHTYIHTYTYLTSISTASKSCVHAVAFVQALYRHNMCNPPQLDDPRDTYAHVAGAVYLRMYACTCVCMHTWHVYMYVCIVCIHTFIRIYMCVYVCMYRHNMCNPLQLDDPRDTYAHVAGAVCLRMYTHMYVCMYVCMYACMYVCMKNTYAHVAVYMYIYIYIHT